MKENRQAGRKQGRRNKDVRDREKEKDRETR